MRICRTVIVLWSAGLHGHRLPQIIAAKRSNIVPQIDGLLPVTTIFQLLSAFIELKQQSCISHHIWRKVMSPARLASAAWILLPPYAGQSDSLPFVSLLFMKTKTTMHEAQHINSHIVTVFCLPSAPKTRFGWDCINKSSIIYFARLIIAQNHHDEHCCYMNTSLLCFQGFCRLHNRNELAPTGLISSIFAYWCRQSVDTTHG